MFVGRSETLESEGWTPGCNDDGARPGTPRNANLSDLRTSSWPSWSRQSGEKRPAKLHSVACREPLVPLLEDAFLQPHDGCCDRRSGGFLWSPRRWMTDEPMHDHDESKSAPLMTHRTDRYQSDADSRRLDSRVAGCLGGGLEGFREAAGRNCGRKDRSHHSLN
jgi:hypothetical protein